MTMPRSIDMLYGYLGSTHANCLSMRRSAGADVFCLAGTSIAYQVKWIAAIWHSSTECEFVTAVGSAKVVKFLCAILTNISILKLEATELYKDNAAAIVMDNAKCPTDRSHHINIQHFALHELVTKGEVILRHIRGTINPDDALIKVLGWLLHHRRSTHVMGMCSSPYSNTSGIIGYLVMHLRQSSATGSHCNIRVCLPSGHSAYPPIAEYTVVLDGRFIVLLCGQIALEFHLQRGRERCLLPFLLASQNSPKVRSTHKASALAQLD
jgi:hypothetical protein